MPLASITLVPLPVPSAASILTVPNWRICSRRSVRKPRSRSSRPTLRLRRPVTP